MTEGIPALRVLHLLLWIVPGGGGVQAYRRALLAAFAGEPGVAMLGAAVHPGGADPGFVEPPHLGRPGSHWRNVLAFARHVWRAAPRAALVQIHGVYGPQFVLGATLCWLRGVRYVVNPHNALAPWMLAHKPLKKRMFFATLGGFLLRRAACVLATSEPEAAHLARRFPGARVDLARPGVEVPPDAGGAMLRDPPDAELRLLYLGSFDEWKRVPNLVRAVATLRASGLPVRATLCGQGTPAQERALAAAIAEAGVAAAVTRAGYVAGPAKTEALRAAHALVLPAATDSYSVAAAEAFAQGLPVVMTEGAGAAPDVRRHGCGSVVPVDDIAALAAAIREYADPATRQARGLAAHRYAREVLALPVLREALTRLYRQLAR